MRSAFAPVALAALAAANPMPQGVTSAISPESTAPAGCAASYNGKFEIATMKINKRDGTPLVLTLNNGILLDDKGRTGYIAKNRQFQFDGPAQTGAIYTAGWSVCGNGSLALGGSTKFYECLSGTFYNLYDESTAAQCDPITIQAVPIGSGTGGEATDGQPTANPVTQISDGQIQATTATLHPVCQISDGQIQQTNCVGPVVTQISDGQIQATTATHGPVVTQISDGQIQATTATHGPVITQISDGQIQATTATGPVVTQISDGQIQASATANGTVATHTPSSVPANGAANLGAGFFGVAAGVVAVALL